MSEWTPTPEQAQIAKTVAAGAFGSLVLVYYRHPGTLLRAFSTVGLGIAMAVTFAEYVADKTFIPLIPAAAGLGMLGLMTAKKIIDWYEKADITAWLKRKVEP